MIKTAKKPYPLGPLKTPGGINILPLFVSRAAMTVSRKYATCKHATCKHLAATLQIG